MLHTFGYGREIEISTRRATSGNETPFQSPTITWYYGPGESKAADVGLTGGPSNLLYVGGSPLKKVSNEKLVDTIEEQVKKELEHRKSNNIIAKG